MPDIVEPTDVELEEFGRRDIARYFTGRFRESIDNLPEHVTFLSEAELMATLDPNPLDYQLRRTFWEAINEADKLQKETLPTARVFKGVCSRQYFDTAVLPNPYRLAWVIRPIVDHSHFYEAINRVALQKLLDYVKTTDIDAKLLPAIIKIAEMSANRAYGAVAQKMQIQSKNLNVEVRSLGENSPPPPDQQQLASKIEAMQMKLMEAKDVTPKE